MSIRDEFLSSSDAQQHSSAASRIFSKLRSAARNQATFKQSLSSQVLLTTPKQLDPKTRSRLGFRREVRPRQAFGPSIVPDSHRPEPVAALSVHQRVNTINSLLMVVHGAFGRLGVFGLRRSPDEETGELPGFTGAHGGSRVQGR